MAFAPAEAAGLVQRQLSPVDRRAVYVSLTDEGERRCAAAVAELTQHRQRLIEILSQLG